jgi:hypothetical protein
MSSIPDAQLQAIADYWASVYQKPYTEEQIQTFKDALKSIVKIEIEQSAWHEEKPDYGSYLRRWICYSDNMNASRSLQTACDLAGLNCKISPFRPCVMSIDPGSVSVDGESIWSADDAGDDVDEDENRLGPFWNIIGGAVTLWLLDRLFDLWRHG